jgi:uncharacterized protein
VRRSALNFSVNGSRSSIVFHRHFPRIPFCVAVATFLFFTGCQKKPQLLTGAQIRAVTREFVLAARNASDGAAQTGMDPERIPGLLQGRRGPANATPSADLIFVTVPGRDAAARQQELDAIDQEIERVATAHGLHRVPRPVTNGVIRYDYFFGEERTHSVHIILPLITNAQAESPFPQVVAASDRRPKLAIILDDLGYDRGAADALMQIPFPITVSVLPLLPHSSEIAEDAFRRGYQVMLHLPMESDSGSKAESVQLQPGMSLDQVALTLESMLETVPHAAGVNNHQGSLSTSDTSLMDEVMPALHDRDLFFVDSRTSSKSVAFDAARRAKVPAATRDIFLDDAEDLKSIEKQLDLAAREARTHGAAIAIGHPHPETIEALTQTLPQLQRDGIDLVFVSRIVR